MTGGGAAGAGAIGGRATGIGTGSGWSSTVSATCGMGTMRGGADSITTSPAGNASSWHAMLISHKNDLGRGLLFRFDDDADSRRVREVTIEDFELRCRCWDLPSSTGIVIPDHFHSTGPRMRIQLFNQAADRPILFIGHRYQAPRP